MGLTRERGTGVYAHFSIPVILRPHSSLPGKELSRSIIFSFAIHNKAMYSNAMLEKELVAASTEPLILTLLSGGESYGYALIQEVKRLSGEKIEWTDGMLYPVLHRMEREGWIASRWGTSETGRKRKYYSLKPDGKKALKAQRDQWVAVSGVFKQLWKEHYV